MDVVKACKETSQEECQNEYYGWSGNSCSQKESENQCNERNDVLCPLTIVFSVVLVFVGSALNFFYWKRQNSDKTERSCTKNSTDNINDNITSTVQHYMEINEADRQITYDENICYTNLNLQL
uniref:Uncharacterized protein n=1 Tax=Magallana gigas TaxID=29159 RepID=A0A8W8MHX9_MAGGI